MEEAEATLGRSLKVWWSFAWRAIALIFVIVLPLEFIALMFVIPWGHIPQPGEKMDPEAMRNFFMVFPIVWLAVMTAAVCAQVLAMRWMLRSARWSDFRVVLVPTSQA